jgi:hypothetical protein
VSRLHASRLVGKFIPASERPTHNEWYALSPLKDILSIHFMLVMRAA